MLCETKNDDLKVLLRSKVCRGQMAKMDSSGKSVCLKYEPTITITNIIIFYNYCCRVVLKRSAQRE